MAALLRLDRMRFALGPARSDGQRLNIRRLEGR